MDINLSITGKMRNYIFMATLGVAAISLVLVFSIASRQDMVYQDNFHRYQQAVQLMQNQQYQAAEDAFLQLDTGFGDSYQVQYDLAICAAGRGDYSAAVNYMQQTLETASGLAANQTFLVEYGRYLFKQGDYQKARLYLQESQKYRTNRPAALEAQQLLQEIDRIDRNLGR